ncbi:MAG: hypothetical protein WCP97_05620 [bacterium]
MNSIGCNKATKRQPLFSKVLHVIVFVYTVFFSCYVLLLFLNFSGGINGYVPANFPSMVYGYGYSPYVSRALLPFFIRFITLITPYSLHQVFLHSFVTLHLSALMDWHQNWETAFISEYLIGCLLIFSCLIGFLVAICGLYRVVCTYSSNIYLYLPILALSGILLHFSYQNYLYDFSTLFLSTIGYLFLYRADWKRYLCIFILAVINKETAILFLLLFSLYYWKSPLLSRKEFIKLSILQIIFFVGIRTTIYFLFQKNLGTPLEFHFYDHTLPIVEHLFILHWNTVIFLLIFLLIIYRWKAKSKFVRLGLWTLVPLVICSLFFGYVDEWRDYYEVYPFILILTVDGGTMFFLDAKTNYLLLKKRILS